MTSLKYWMIGAALLFGTAAHAQSAFDTAVESQPGLLGYWTFTPALQADSAVNGYTGSFLGAAAVGPKHKGPPVDCTCTSEVVLNPSGSGNDSVVSGGVSPLLGQIDQAGTILAWVNLAALPSTEGRYFSIAGESQPGNDLDLQLQNDNRLYFYTDGGSATVTTATATSADLNRWVFIAATFVAGGSRVIYVNGKLAGTGSAGGHALNSAPFYVGESTVFGGRYFSGNISDVAVYNVALTARQIRGIYAARLNPPPARP
jgi:hypothetical protein